MHELLPQPEADVTEKRDREMLAANATLFVEAKPTDTPQGNALHVQPARPDPR